ncbi:MAG: hypothetical protein RMX96_18965 [Nostoc sp. ChiSLP02]|nr:hypothetical protein [Nostoc sp. DedSLP05]MDZ8102686.1 hypothetical protein [Nostoc sp. DedSLP01]MDZ8186917.1 hypothetical protein [Nostoc sp. ChiSLP02]
MESPTSQQVSLDSLTLEQLQNEIRQEISEIVQSSRLSKVLEKYGLSKKNALKIQCSVNLTQAELNDAKCSFLAHGKQIVLATCCLEGEICVKCKP